MSEATAEAVMLSVSLTCVFMSARQWIYFSVRKGVTM